MTGHADQRANSSTVSWRNVRRTTASTYWLSVRATSGRLSRLPSPESLWLRNTASPPSWLIPAWKLTRVRSDGFSNSSPSTRPLSTGLAFPLACDFLRRTASLSSLRMRPRSQSTRSMKCRRCGAGRYRCGCMFMAGSSLAGHQRVFEHVTTFAELVVGEIERRQEAEHVPVGAVDEQPALQAAIDERRAVDRQLDADHAAQDTDLVDQRATGLERLEACSETAGNDRRAGQQAVRFN